MGQEEERAKLLAEWDKSRRELEALVRTLKDQGEALYGIGYAIKTEPRNIMIITRETDKEPLRGVTTFQYEALEQYFDIDKLKADLFTLFHLNRRVTELKEKLGI